MLQKVTYHWYKQIIEIMKETVNHLKDVKSLPLLLMYGTEDKVADVTAMDLIKEKSLLKNYISRLGMDYTMKYIMNLREMKS